MPEDCLQTPDPLPCTCHVEHFHTGRNEATQGSEVLYHPVLDGAVVKVAQAEQQRKEAPSLAGHPAWQMHQTDTNLQPLAILCCFLLLVEVLAFVLQGCQVPIL